MYDFANTAFSALFVTFFFPLFLKVFLDGNEFQIGLVMGLSMLAAGILVPFIGAASDVSKRRIPFVVVFTTICVACVILTAFSNLALALVFAFLANFTYHAALDVYDSLLTSVSTRKTRGKISGLGVSFGYIGTIASLIMAFALLSSFGWETKQGVQAVFVGTGIFYLIFSLFTFFLVKEKFAKKVLSFKEMLKRAFNQVKYTFTHFKKYKHAFIFLLASFLFMDAMNTIIIFFYLYGKEIIGITVLNFFYVYTIFAVFAAVGAFLFGKITDKKGHKKTMVGIIIVWTMIILLLAVKSNMFTFILAGCIGGAVLGGIWTVTRPLLLTLIPKRKTAEFFGFQGVTEKFGGVIGPIAFGYIVVKAGYRPALFVVIGFFLLALLLLKFVPAKD